MWRGANCQTDLCSFQVVNLRKNFFVFMICIYIKVFMDEIWELLFPNYLVNISSDGEGECWNSPAVGEMEERE